MGMQAALLTSATLKCCRATAEVATLKEAVSKAENSAALEHSEREKQEARVAEVRQ